MTTKSAKPKKKTRPGTPPSAHKLSRFETRLGYAFSNRGLLLQALTHASADKKRRKAPPQTSTKTDPSQDNERLEFLGDRVLGLLAAEALMTTYPKAREGELAPRLNALVRKETCADVARALEMGDLLVLAAGEEQGGGREKNAILGDACEALLAALYLDGGLAAARGVFERFWSQRLGDQGVIPRDAKTLLQEWAQGERRATPSYEAISHTGPDHAPEFVVEVSVEGLAPARAAGPSKRRAEQAAAEAMLRREGLLDTDISEGEQT